MSYYYDIAGQSVSVWQLYLYDGNPQVAISLGAIAKKSVERAGAFLEQLRSDPVLADALANVDASTLNKFPQIHIDPVLLSTGTQAAFFAAIDKLVASNHQ